MDPFEWDEEKNLANVAKHGMSFEAVDERFDCGKCRIIAVGIANGRVLVVVSTMRGEARRIISARIASSE